MSVLTLRNGAFVPGITQNITTTGGSQLSTAFASTTSIIRVTTQVDIYVQLGTTTSPPSATTGSMLVLAGITEFLAVPAAMISSTGVVTQQSQIAILQAGASAGVVGITQLTGYSN
jgi:hypothetical protein